MPTDAEYDMVIADKMVRECYPHNYSEENVEIVYRLIRDMKRERREQKKQKG